MGSDSFRLGGDESLNERRFMPNNYYRDLYLKLQGLNQGYKTVDEYHKETLPFYKQCTVHIFIAHLFSSLANRNAHAIHPRFSQPQSDPLNQPPCA